MIAAGRISLSPRRRAGAHCKMIAPIEWSGPAKADQGDVGRAVIQFIGSPLVGNNNNSDKDGAGQSPAAGSAN